MDPNETLNRLRQYADEDLELEGMWSLEEANARCQAYAELFQVLDEWITSSGFLPNDWQQHRW